MLFTVIPPRSWPSHNAPQGIYLIRDQWDDYGYKTQFLSVWCDGVGRESEIGPVKIGRFGRLEAGPIEVPTSFNRLPAEFFSVGQDPSYYEALNALGSAARDTILDGLRDMAVQTDRFLVRALEQEITQSSLMRSVPYGTLVRQFRRVARGGLRLSEYRFVYEPPGGTLRSWDRETGALSFEVDPDSAPPTNIHVLIGRNGVGKSTLLQRMARALVDKQAGATDVGYFREQDESAPWESVAPIFANVVSVSFSAFDNFLPVDQGGRYGKGEVGYSYIGLNEPSRDTYSGPESTDLAERFSESVILCVSETRLQRWLGALATLESDPMFMDAEVGRLAELAGRDRQLMRHARELFDQLSSGHKIVLLTLTRLVETVEERSLVLIDEPESHLHPPLLAAFVRVLSELLADRNGVAIVATHSPVVLQEVPRSCVWKIRRSGSHWIGERPEVETFGENVGVLTREVFGLEVVSSGFHQMIRQLVYAGGDYSYIVEQFSGQLGGEARALVRALIAARDSEARR